MSADATLTDFLARIFGLYMLAAGTGLALNNHNLPKMLEEMRQPFLFYLGGLMAFAMGAVIVGVHNDVSGPLAIFITLIGWVALAEGVIMLAFPKVLLAFADRMLGLMDSGRVWGIAVAALGAVLLMIGFA